LNIDIYITFYDILYIIKKNMENEGENWKICCSNSSSHFIKFFTTFSICFSVMIFSMIQIIQNPESDKDNSIYFR